jgi:hypothetical protein
LCALPPWRHSFHGSHAAQLDDDGVVARTTRGTLSAHSTERNPYPCKLAPINVGNIYNGAEAELN